MEACERVLRRGTGTFRPLASWLGVRAGGSSRNLQRAVVDFGAEESFATASERLELHHAVVLSASSVRKLTLEHARRIRKEQVATGGQGASPETGSTCIVTEIDGTMLPVVRTDKGSEGNARKNRECLWKETRLCAAREHGKSTTRYTVTDAGVEEAGYAWAKAVFDPGWNPFKKKLKF